MAHRVNCFCLLTINNVRGFPTKEAYLQRHWRSRETEASLGLMLAELKIRLYRQFWGGERGRLNAEGRMQIVEPDGPGHLRDEYPDVVRMLCRNLPPLHPQARLGTI